MVFSTSLYKWRYDGVIRALGLHHFSLKALKLLKYHRNLVRSQVLESHGALHL